MPKKLIYRFLFFVCMLCSSNAFAQELHTVSGTITDEKSGKPIIYANAALKGLYIGTSSNKKGEFVFPLIPSGTYELTVTCLGYKEYTTTLSLSENISINIQLKQQSLGLKEIIVVAEQSSRGTTSSLIKSEAIDHVQASSLKEIMQLVPGNLLTNPNLSDPARVSIREIGSDINSALGSPVIIDDIPISNDGNLQQSINIANKITSVAGSGLDIRSISVDNIESISVDVGIPSAEYGNLTSGAVHIKTKSGQSPFHVKMKADPKTKQAYLGKGILLGNDLGVVNIDLDYAHAFQHIYKKTNLYDRYNLNTKYTRTLFRESNPLNIEAKLKFSYNQDSNEDDLDENREEEHYSEEYGILGKLSANWSLNKPFLKSITLDFAYIQDWQNGFEKTLESSSTGASFHSTSKTDGEYQVGYVPSTYYSEVSYDGKPFQLYAKLKGMVVKQTVGVKNRILVGAEWRTTGNNGRGRLFDANIPPSGLGVRQRPFTDIPSLNQFSFFIEDNASVKLGSTSVDIMAGLRMDNIQPSGVFTTDGNLSVDPRVNVRYNMLNQNNNRLLSNLSFKFGYGKTTKSPTLLHLYPDKKYNDVVSFNYYPDLIVTTTSVVEDTRNDQLEPARSNKYETGVDLQLGQVKLNFTGFYEEHEGGYILDRTLYPMHYRNYDNIPSGLNPYYISGEGIYFNDQQTGTATRVGFQEEVKFVAFSQYRNARKRIKRGVEYVINIGKIDPINTSFLISGAWLKTESSIEDAPYYKSVHYTVYENNVSKDESFVVKFSDRNGYSIIDERLNTNLTIVNHVPELKMLVTLTSQVVWYEKNRRKVYAGNNLYTLSGLREYLGNPEIFANDQEGDFYYQVPETYTRYDMIEHTYSVGDFSEPLHQNAISKNQGYEFNEMELPSLFLCNIKVSKDIASRFRLSFYANNFFNIRPWHLNEREGIYVRRNSEPFFGAELSMKL